MRDGRVQREKSSEPKCGIAKDCGTRKLTRSSQTPTHNLRQGELCRIASSKTDFSKSPSVGDGASVGRKVSFSLKVNR